MKKFFLIFTVLFISYNIFSQSFTFVRTSPPVVEGPADTIFDSYATVNNTTNANITLHFSASNVIVPAGWDTMGICTWQLCYGAGYFNITQVAEPGPHQLHLYTYPGGVPGNSSCRITITYQSESVYQDFGFHANPLGINQISTIAKEFSLGQNYPNPFNPTTMINFSIPKSEYVSLRVYDILGREVKALVNENLGTGEYRVDFDASSLSSGMYYYSLRAGDNVSVKKMVLVK